jgi:hypothetical protein
MTALMNCGDPGENEKPYERKWPPSEDWQRSGKAAGNRRKKT